LLRQSLLAQSTDERVNFAPVCVRNTQVTPLVPVKSYYFIGNFIWHDRCECVDCQNQPLEVYDAGKDSMWLWSTIRLRYRTVLRPDPVAVTCPVCGADGTGAANEVIAFNLAAELSTHNSHPEGVMLLAVVGCLMAGIVGVIKASTMASGLDVLLCLWGSVLAFGVAIGVYVWKHARRLPGLAKKRALAPARRAPANRRFLL
jgi:hypothetical protein